jgi:hypothetical protein
LAKRGKNMHEGQEESKTPGQVLFRWALIFGGVWLILSMFSGGNKQDNRSYTIHLKEPMKVEMTDPSKEVTVIHTETYQWANAGAILQIERLGRVILIPTSSIKFIESWDPTAEQRRE